MEERKAKEEELKRQKEEQDKLDEIRIKQEIELEKKEVHEENAKIRRKIKRYTVDAPKQKE